MQTETVLHGPREQKPLLHRDHPKLQRHTKENCNLVMTFTENNKKTNTSVTKLIIVVYGVRLTGTTYGPDAK